MADRARTLRDVEDFIGADIKLPPEGLTKGVNAMYTSKPTTADPIPYAVFLFGNGMILDVTRMPSANDARLTVEDSDDDDGLAPWTEKLEIAHRTARAHDRLDVAPSWDSSGNARPGTGIRTGNAKIMWAEGSLVVTVKYTDWSRLPLVAVARSLSVTERRP